MNKYRELQKRVYEIIYPDGIPFQLGCEFRQNKDLHHFTLVATEDNYDDSDKASAYIIDSKDRRRPINVYRKYVFDCENLGKPLQLQDVLRAIEIKGKCPECKGESNPYTGCRHCDCNYHVLNDVVLMEDMDYEFFVTGSSLEDIYVFLFECLIDLSKPIQEQDEEVHEQLIALLK